MTAIVRAADAEAIREAAERLRAGELVAFPTETVYGLGANALNPQAVLRIFAAKGRPADNPLIAHICDAAQLRDVARSTPEAAKALMAAFWPGPLTLVLPRTPGISDAVTAGLDTVAVRMPDHPVARDLLRACGFPVAAPSANRSGRPSPTTAGHVFEDMGDKIPMILDGGPCPIGLESTVVDVAHGTPVLLRPGGVTLEMLRDVTETRLGHGVMEPLGAEEPALSPGLKHRHYAPRARLTLFSGDNEGVAREIAARYDALAARGERPAILCASRNATRYGAGRNVWPLDGEMGVEGAAHGLFGALRALDERGVTAILCETWPTEGLGLAVMNRLSRAAAFEIVEVDAP